MYINMQLTYLIFAFIALICVQISSGGITTCECPSYKLKFDVNNATQYSEGLRSIVSGLWSASSPVLSSEGQRMKKAVLTMANSDSSMWNMAAVSDSAWTWSNLPHFKDAPTLCAFSQVINATLEWDKNKDGASIAKAVDNVAKYVHYSSMRILTTASINAGCEPPKQKIPTISCYKDGSVYPIKDMWRSRGDVFPCILQSSSQSLYNSCRWEDRAMAAISTATLTEPFNDFARLFDSKVMFGIFSAQLTKPIPKCCCSSFVDHVSSLVDDNRREALRVAEIIKKAYPVKTQ